jgi:hypothetical protein
MTVGQRKYGQVNTNVYLCGWRKNRGFAVCRNMTVEPVHVVDDRVVAAVGRLITPGIVADVIRQAREIHAERQAAVPAESERLRTEVAKLRRGNRAMTAAIASSDAPPGPLVQVLA